MAREIRWIGFRSGDGATPFMDAYLWQGKRKSIITENDDRERSATERGSADQLPFSLTLLCVCPCPCPLLTPFPSFLSCNFFSKISIYSYPPYPHPPFLSLRLKGSNFLLFYLFFREGGVGGGGGGGRKTEREIAMIRGRVKG